MEHLGMAGIKQSVYGRHVNRQYVYQGDGTVLSE